MHSKYFVTFTWMDFALEISTTPLKSNKLRSFSFENDRILELKFLNTAIIWR